MRGVSVVRASGRRRVRKSVEAWRYVLEMCDVWRAAVVEEESDEMDEERRLRAKGSAVEDVVMVGLEPLKAEPLRDDGIVGCWLLLLCWCCCHGAVDDDGLAG